MNMDHAVSWGRGSGLLALAILVGLAIPEVVVGQPKLKKKTENESLAVWLGWWFDNNTHV